MFDGMYEFCQLSAGGSIGKLMIGNYCNILEYLRLCVIVPIRTQLVQLN